jgi:hypothetical protein
VVNLSWTNLGVPDLARVGVSGFKSLAERVSVEIRPLTILAGANSSGKSSLMQPLLMLKQTLDAAFEPDGLVVAGGHVVLPPSGAFMSGHEASARSSFSLRMELGNGWSLKAKYLPEEGRIRPAHVSYAIGGVTVLRLGRGWPHARVVSQNPSLPAEFRYAVSDRSRVLLLPRYSVVVGPGDAARFPLSVEPVTSAEIIAESCAGALRAIVHVAGVRGLPNARSYPVPRVTDTFDGPFHLYTGAVLEDWHRSGAKQAAGTAEDLRTLGIGSAIRAQRAGDSVTVEVDPSPESTVGGAVLRNVADLGLGVPQALPVVVGLHTAISGQLVYIEQPELHLHPRAQVAMARILANAAERGVRVVAETHSSLLLLGVQDLIARGELDPSLVILHWFERDPNTGVTKVTSCEPHETGTFDRWPVDFDDIELDLQRSFLDATRKRRREQPSAASS